MKYGKNFSNSQKRLTKRENGKTEVGRWGEANRHTVCVWGVNGAIS